MMQVARKHRFNDYEPDVNICNDKVKIISKYNCENNKVGYMSRYDSDSFNFESMDKDDETCKVVLDYEDWIIEYIK